MSKFTFFIIDLDGVIFDSKENMKYSWMKTCKYFNIKKSFKKYFAQIGMPFDQIIKSIGIDPNPEIKNYYKLQSIKSFNKIKVYKGVIATLLYFDKKKIPYSIVTSKDFERSKILLKKYNIKPKSLHCPEKNIRGKPHPDLIINALKKNKKLPQYTCYVGDTNYDFVASRRAKISFIFAKYGYGKKIQKYSLSINSFSQLKEFS